MASPPPGFLAPSSDHGYDIGGNLTSALVIGAAAILCTFALVVFYFVRYICIGRQLQHADFSSGSCNGSNENKALVLKELPVVSWNELLGKKKMKGDEACPVCLGDFGDLESDGSSDAKLRLLPRCGHCFHSQCVDGWLNEHSLCPVCRGSWLPLDLKAAAALLSGSLDSDSVGNLGGLSSVVNSSGVSSDRAEVLLEGQHGQGGGGGGAGGVIDLESGGRGLSLVEGNGAEGSK